ncbi:hypothetical protein BGX38DRAFT_1212181 [Terfezia claveryi]|nr:hypothetical protein BGX38DRAFT_1212181 [Terfezia claveryi]
MYLSTYRRSTTYVHNSPSNNTGNKCGNRHTSSDTPYIYISIASPPVQPPSSRDSAAIWIYLYCTNTRNTYTTAPHTRKGPAPSPSSSSSSPNKSPKPARSKDILLTQSLTHPTSLPTPLPSPHTNLLPSFRVLCTGSADTTPTGTPLHYSLSTFHRIISDYLVQGGDITHGNGTGGHSIYGPHFPDENLGWRSIDCPGLVCMANRGPDTNNSQFFITLDAATHLDTKNVCFGQVVSGMETVRRMEEVTVDEKDRPVEGQQVRIMRSGELEFRHAPAIPEKVSKPKPRARRSPDAMDISSRSRSQTRSRSQSRTPTTIRRHILPSGTRRGRSPPPPFSNPTYNPTSSTVVSPFPRSASPARSPYIQKGNGSNTTHTHTQRRRSRSGSRSRHHRRYHHHQRKSSTSRSRSRSKSRSRRHRDRERKPTSDRDRSVERYTHRYDHYRHRSPSSEARIRKEEELRERGRLDDLSMSGISSTVEEPTVKFKGRGSMKYRERWGGGGGGGRRGGGWEYGRLG